MTLSCTLATTLPLLDESQVTANNLEQSFLSNATADSCLD